MKTLSFNFYLPVSGGDASCKTNAFDALILAAKSNLQYLIINCCVHYQIRPFGVFKIIGDE